MLDRLKVQFFESIYMRKGWEGFRDVLVEATVPNSGGVVLLGDSLTHLARWEILFPDVPVRNFGIGGERSEHVLERLDPIIRLRPHQLFLLIGTNDLAYEHPIEEIAARVDTILERLAKALPDCRLHLQGLMPRQQKYAERIRSLNGLYQKVASQRRVNYIELFPLFATAEGQMRTELTHDGLHLSGAGYNVWRQELSRWIRPAGN